MATIIFDFDDTLFNTKKFIADIIKTIKTEGVPEHVIRDTYEKMTDDFSFKKYVEAINEKKSINLKKVIKNLEGLFSPRYVKKETFRLLETLNKQEHNLLLLTLSDKSEFQKLKIKKSTLEKYFKPENIFIVKESKLLFLRKNKILGDVHFINDKKRENLEISREFKNFKVHLVGKENTLKKISSKIK